MKNILFTIFIFSLSILGYSQTADVCSDAIILPVATGSPGTCSYTSYDNTGNTDSGVPVLGDCASSAPNDIWFKFEIPASGSCIVETNDNGGISNGVIELYSGDCNNLSLINCEIDGNTLMPIVYGGGTPGDTLWVRFWKYNGGGTGTFDICVIEDNATCSDGIQNGDESGIDCGGTAGCDDCTPCPDQWLGYHLPSNDWCESPSVIINDPEGTIAIDQHDYSSSDILQLIYSAEGCGDPQYDVFLQFEAYTSEVSFDFLVEYDNCSYLTAVVWEIGTDANGCCNLFTKMGCLANMNTNSTLTVSGLTQGNNYVLILDGSTIAGSMCEFTIAGWEIFTGPLINELPDTIVCDTFILPIITGTNLSGNEYYCDDITIEGDPAGTHYNAGDTITTNQLPMYIYDNNGTGHNLVDFNITIVQSPQVDDLQDTIVCGSYTLPTITGNHLSGNEAYYEFTNGEGTQYNVGNFITTNHTIFIYDENGSCSDEQSFIIIITPIPTATISGNGTICADSTANITIDFTGSANWTYTWTDGTSQSTLTSLSSQQILPFSDAGTYTLVDVVDNTGCSGTVSGSAVIDVNILPTPIILGDTAYCTGLSIVLDAQAGYNSYLWSDGSTNQTLAVSTTGQYIVTVTDANGCKNTDTVKIAEYSLPNVNAGLDKEMCNGGNTDINASGSGVATLTYLWDNSLGAGASQNVSPTSTTTYTVTVTDGNGCENTDQILVSVNELPIADAGTNSSICFGDTITIDAAGSSAISPATIIGYQWSNTINTVSQDVNPTNTTTYSVVVTDSKTCTDTADITITVNQLPSFNIPIMVDLTSCGTPNGEITITGQGGHPGYDYNINGSTFGATNHWDTLNAISYTYGVVDSEGCEYYEDFAIENSMGANIDSVIYDELMCNGDTTSELIIHVASSNIYYSIDNGTNLQSSNTFTNLGADSYQVFIIDSTTTCEVGQTVIISEPSQLQNTFTTYDIDCYSDNTGSIVANYSEGTPGYTTDWASDSISNLVANTWYYINIADTNGCKLKDSVMLSQPSELIVDTIESTNLLCNGDASGYIAIGISGGTLNYNFAWDGMTASDSSLFYLSGGTYYFTVTDQNNCTVNDSVIIYEPENLVLSSSTSNAICASNNGTAEINVSGGTLDYTYSWSHDNALDTNVVIGLSPGNYNVVITDFNLCEDSLDFEIQNQAAGTAQFVVSSNINCFGGNNGLIIIQINGGTPDYSYAWYNDSTLVSTNVSGNSNDTLINIPSGNYSVEITDDMGCISNVDSIEITQPTKLNGIPQITDITCFNENNGSISITGDGGIAPYSYLWSTDDTTQTIDSLSEATYSVIITDDNGCLAQVTSINVVNPSLLELDIFNITNVSCFGDNNGAASFDVYGGTPSYTYMLNDEYIDITDLSDLRANNYIITAIDSNSCIVIDTFNISEPLELTIIDTVFIDNNNGNINTQANGGTPGYTYYWSTGEITQDLNGLDNGEYFLTITDDNTCSIVGTYIIEIPLFIPTVITPNADGFNDTWQIIGIDAFEDIEIHIFNRWGDKLYEFNGSGYEYSQTSIAWNGMWNNKELPLGTYVYILIVKDNNEKYNGTVTIVR